VVHILFSHPHWTTFRASPFSGRPLYPVTKFYLYGVHDIEVVLRRQQEFITFPVSLDYMQADLHFVRLEPGETLEFNDLRIRCKPTTILAIPLPIGLKRAVRLLFTLLTPLTPPVLTCARTWTF